MCGTGVEPIMTFLLRMKRNTTVLTLLLALVWTKICINLSVFLICILRSNNYFSSFIDAFQHCFKVRQV